METNKALREHLLELLRGKFAHIELETVLHEFPIAEINTRLENAPHTAWELLEHLRIAQHDIVKFSHNAEHVSPEFPEGCWNKTEATADDWRNSTAVILKDLQTMRDLVNDENNDLFAELPHGDGQTILHEALLVADHNAYHLGQIAFLMRILEARQNAR